MFHFAKSEIAEALKKVSARGVRIYQNLLVITSPEIAARYKEEFKKIFSTISATQ